jgi:hypothetical protein
MWYVLDTAVGAAPKIGASDDENAVYQTKVDDASMVLHCNCMAFSDLIYVTIKLHNNLYLPGLL